MDEEYYMIEAIKATGGIKYLIVRIMDGVPLVYDKWDDRVCAVAQLDSLNREA